MFLLFIKKAALLFSSLLVIVTLTFFLMHAIPGDPFVQEKALSEEVLLALRKHYGLDQPLLVQYGCYLREVACGNLGPSFHYQGQAVATIIKEGLPISLYLGLQALVCAVFSGFILGSLAALYHQRWQDHLTMIVSIIGISVPSFILATYLQYVLAIQFDLLPVARWGSFSQTLLPTLSLAALPTAFIARLLRANMIEVWQQGHIQTAIAKGLGKKEILLHHVLRNSLLPVVTYLGPLSAAILTGSFAVEKIFAIPGLGQWFVLSITNRDYAVIMGITLFYSALLLLCVFIVDCVYCLIDPRLKTSRI